MNANRAHEQYMEWGREVEAERNSLRRRIENFVERRRRPMMLTITTSWRYDAHSSRDPRCDGSERSGRSKQPVQADRR